MRLTHAALLFLLLSPAAHAQPVPPPPWPAPEAPRPFGRGSMNAGFNFGLNTGQGTTISLAGDFGYFVLSGLEPGLAVGVTFGSGNPTVTSLMPYLRWVVWRSYAVSPYLKLQGGHWFISGPPDVSPVGGGGGLVIFLTRVLAVQLEGMIYRLFPGSACGDNCTTTSFGVSLGFFFGGRRPAPPPPPPPPLQPPPAAAPPHEAAPATAPAAPASRGGPVDEPGLR